MICTRQFERKSKKGFLITGLLCLSVLVLLLGITQGLQAKTVIRYWTFIDPAGEGPRVVAQRMRVDAFEVQNPEIKVSIEIQHWAKITSLLIMSAAAGRGPDLVRVLATDLKRQVEAGTVASMDKYTDNWTPEQKEDWLIPWEVTVFNGHKFFLPIEHRVFVLEYRKDLLEKAGLPVPTNYAELAEAAEAITTDRVMGIIIPMAPPDLAFDLAVQVDQTLWSAGKSIIYEDGRTAFNSEPVVRLFKWIKSLIESGAMTKEVVGMDGEAAMTGMQAGTIGFYTEGSHRIETARSTRGMREKIGTAHTVTFEDYKPCQSFSSGWHFAIGINSAHKDEAWKFIEYIVSPEMQLINAVIGGEMPSRKSAYQSPWFQVPWRDEKVKEMLRWKDYMLEGHLAVFHEENELWKEYLMKAAHEIVLGHSSIEEALDKYAIGYNKEVGAE